MEEKILIKSEIDKEVKNTLRFGPLVLFFVAVLCAIYLTFSTYTTSYGPYYWGSYTYSGWDMIFDFGPATMICFYLFLLGSLALLSSIILCIVYLAVYKCELQITESSVIGKTKWGKEVVLPLHMVSAYSTRKTGSVITVATASGFTKFALIGNYKEIGEVLGRKIGETKQADAPVVQAAPTNNAMDDLVKLKALLDQGVITQEEFDAKKKQLLGL